MRVHESVSVEHLIYLSVCHNEVVVTDYSEDLAKELFMLCDNTVKHKLETEYWGVDEESNEWRIHLSHPQKCYFVNDFDEDE